MAGVAPARSANDAPRAHLPAGASSPARCCRHHHAAGARALATRPGPGGLGAPVDEEDQGRHNSRGGDYRPGAADGVCERRQCKGRHHRTGRDVFRDPHAEGKDSEAARTARGVRTAKTPQLVATPFPPRKPSPPGKMCLTTAATPATAGTAVSLLSRWATTTGCPLQDVEERNQDPGGRPRRPPRLPHRRLPLPMSRRSLVPHRRAMISANGMDPMM